MTTRKPGILSRSMLSPTDDVRLRRNASFLKLSSKSSSSSSSSTSPMTTVSSKAGNDLTGDWISVRELVVDDESSGEVGGTGEVSVSSLVRRLPLELWTAEDFLLIFGVVLGVPCLDGTAENARIGFGRSASSFNVSFGLCKIRHNFQYFKNILTQKLFACSLHKYSQGCRLSMLPERESTPDKVLKGTQMTHYDTINA